MSAIFFATWCLIAETALCIFRSTEAMSRLLSVLYCRSSGNGLRYSIQLVTQQVLYFTTDITRHQLSEHP